MVTKEVGGVYVIDPSERDIKRVKVSKQRQVSIPKEYYELLDFANEASIEYTGTSLIIRPIKNDEVDFSEYILRDLIEEGYSGEDLIAKFTEMKSKLPSALDRLIEDSNTHIVDGDLDDYLDSLEDEE